MLPIFIGSSQTDDTLDWHRHGNTGGLRAESEVEKVLKVIHNFIKTHSTLLLSLSLFVRIVQVVTQHLSLFRDVSQPKVTQLLLKVTSREPYSLTW